MRKAAQTISQDLKLAQAAQRLDAPYVVTGILRDEYGTCRVYVITWIDRDVLLAVMRWQFLGLAEPMSCTDLGVDEDDNVLACVALKILS